MKKLTILALLACTLLCGSEAFAQAANRAGSGEKRILDRKSDVGAYDVMKTHVDSEFKTVVETADTQITAFNGNIVQIRSNLSELEDAIDALEASLHDEDDPSVRVSKLADTRQLGGTGVPVCNKQTEEVYFNKNNSGRWSCEPGMTGCMASQNIWRE